MDVLDARVQRVRGRANGSTISLKFEHGSSASEDIVWRTRWEEKHVAL